VRLSNPCDATEKRAANVESAHYWSLFETSEQKSFASLCCVSISTSFYGGAINLGPSGYVRLPACA